jgi:hypothetical protein
MGHAVRLAHHPSRPCPLHFPFPQRSSSRVCVPVPTTSPIQGGGGGEEGGRRDNGENGKESGGGVGVVRAVARGGRDITAAPSGGLTPVMAATPKGWLGFRVCVGGDSSPMT